MLLFHVILALFRGFEGADFGGKGFHFYENAD